jgi:hypothetical protein
MPMKPGLSFALSEFSRGRWAVEPAEPPLHPTELNLLTRVWSRLSRLAPLTFARYLIAFFIGVVATLAWQSYRGGAREENFAAASVDLDSLRQSVDKLAAEIAKVRAAEQDILERISAPSPRPGATPARSPASRPSAVR